MKTKTALAALFACSMSFLPAQEAPNKAVLPQKAAEKSGPQIPVEKRVTEIFDLLATIPDILTEVKDEPTMAAAQNKLAELGTKLEREATELSQSGIPPNETRKKLAAVHRSRTQALNRKLQAALMRDPVLYQTKMQMLMGINNSKRKITPILEKYCEPDDETLWASSHKNQQLELFLERYISPSPGTGVERLRARAYLRYNGKRINIGESRFGFPGMTYSKYLDNPVFLDGLEIIRSERQDPSGKNKLICSVPPDVIEKVEFPLFVEALDHNLDDIVQAIRTHKLPEEIKGILGIAGLDQVEAYVWGGRRAFRSQDGLRLLEIRIDGNTSLHEFRPPGGRNSHGAGQLVVENGRRVLKSGGWGDLKIKDLISASMIEFSPSSPPPFDGSGARFSAFAEIR